jgi:hypothetical protein
MPARMPASAVAEADDVSDEDLIRTEAMPVRQWVGGWVIHFPPVVCTSSPNTITSVDRPAIRGDLGWRADVGDVQTAGYSP